MRDLKILAKVIAKREIRWYNEVVTHYHKSEKRGIELKWLYPYAHLLTILAFGKNDGFIIVWFLSITLFPIGFV